MSASSAAPAPPDYGLDAPPVVRNLLVIGAVALASWSLAAMHLWSGSVRLTGGDAGVVLVLAPAGLIVGVGCLAMAAWMVWWGHYGKVREREQLLDLIPWRGDERVLDVGCGRGLLALGAARRLRTGRAVGVDLWRGEDLAGNTSQAFHANAVAEGVADRVSVETADMRALPFGDASFDVILSRAAIHNLPTAADRRAAITEIIRVMAPGSRAVLSDIRHLGEYAALFDAHRLPVTVTGSRLVRLGLTLLTWGALRPGVLCASRPPAASPEQPSTGAGNRDLPRASHQHGLGPA